VNVVASECRVKVKGITRGPTMTRQHKIYTRLYIQGIQSIQDTQGIQDIPGIQDIHKTQDIRYIHTS